MIYLVLSICSEVRNTQRHKKPQVTVGFHLESQDQQSAEHHM
jgi:hypothetical protein